MKHLARAISRWALSLHIYISVAGLMLVLLFALTGLTLNHDDFGLSEPTLSTSTLTIPRELLAAGDEQRIVERLRTDLGLSAPVTRYRTDEEVIDVTFTAPGRRTQAAIQRADGTARIETESRGLIGKLDDLHKGLESGDVWSGVIDITAVLLVGSSLTGIITLLSLPKRRARALVAGAIVWVVLVLAYAIWVPK